MSRTDYIVIIGCGRLGSNLANRLSGTGYQLVLVDKNEYSFDMLTSDFSGFKVVGDAIELDVLRQTRLEKATSLFATTTYDNVNLMVAQIAKTIFHVPKVIARVYDPARESIYKELGVETISPTKLSSEAFIKMLNTPKTKFPSKEEE